ncbi:MarR family winged helix-turn-helix transcriptional regulator [Rouxiella sp. WC2420]|uniref:MarR family winged helix-turn-helix transcriptional regulator n=1 Tax=Rouxiella sp. WC2420 TaxID=3234145 RepID=A0AB39VJ95_9GAMM
MSDKSAALFALTNSLQPVKRVWRQAATQIFANSGISMSLANLVVIVNRNAQGINQRDLAEEIGMNPGAMVRILDQGTEAEYLERRELSRDRRFKTICILPAGKKLADEIESSANKLRVQLMEDVSVEDIENATRVLRLLEARASNFLQEHIHEKK